VPSARAALSPRFDEIYGDNGRLSTAPERLLRALLLQILYNVRSERMLMLDSNQVDAALLGVQRQGKVGQTACVNRPYCVVGNARGSVCPH
jgi:hypothetical protein